MARVLPLYLMASNMSLEGMALAEEAIPNSEILQCIMEMMEPPWDDMDTILDFVYPVSGHLPMRSELGFVQFVSLPLSCLFFSD